MSWSGWGSIDNPMPAPSKEIGCSLESIIDHSLSLRKVRKADLSPGDHFFVKTCNSLYDIQVLSEEMYCVTGGWFDKNGLSPMKTKITGCSWGASVIKTDIVAARGLRLEFGNRLSTSPIREVILLSVARQT
jgi:hypothetical protein